MSTARPGNYQSIYATAFQDACNASEAELTSLIAQPNGYVAHVDDVRDGLKKLEAALKRFNK